MDFWRFNAVEGLGEPLRASYDPALVVLSILVASFGALTALAVVHRVIHTRTPRGRFGWHATGSVAMGLGVWAMHFTAMLAFTLPVPTSYVLTTTAASVIPAILGSAVALAVMSRSTVEWWRLQVGGLSLALGIGAMHYLGMEGVRNGAMMRYVPALFVLSIIVAHLLATIALYVRFAGGAEWPGRHRRLLSAFVMGLAVSGMHYTAMAAVRFYPVDIQGVSSPTLPPDILGVTIVLIVAFFLALALVGTVFDQMLSAAHQASMDSEARLKAAVETMAEGLLAVDPDGTITTANPAAEKMFGKELLGTRIDALIRRHLAPEGSESGVADVVALLEESQARSSVVTGIREGGAAFIVGIRSGKMVIGDDVLYSVVLRDITESRAAEEERNRLAAAIDQAGEGLVVTDPQGIIEYVNPAFAAQSGSSKSELVGTLAKVFDQTHQTTAQIDEIWAALRSAKVWSGSLSGVNNSGEAYDAEVTISGVTDDAGEVVSLVAVERDVTAQKALERQLGQSQKLEAIGQLAAGIAHEINTPTQYVGDNTRFLADAFKDLDSLFERLSEATSSDELSDDQWAAIRKAYDGADVEYLEEEIPKALQQSIEGIDRVTEIVRAMKEFSHPSVEKTSIDLNRAISSTVTVARNEWKYVADCEEDFDAELPHVTCVPGELNQVVLNMIVNASHAIADVVGDGGEAKGTIRIATRKVGEWAEIQISDTGSGMPDHVREKIFDPFFTTKDVGKGTGQGLSIAHSVIVQNHGGTIEVESEQGEGTRFTIRLPIEGVPSDSPEDHQETAGVL